MEINTKTVFAILLVSLLSGCYVILDDSDTDEWYDSYGTHYEDVPWVDTGATYWYCEDYYEHGSWHNYWEFYTVATDAYGYSDTLSIEYNVYYYGGDLAFWGDLYSLNTWGGLDEEFYNSNTFYYDSFPCNDIYEVEFYVEDWDGNYTSLWIY